MARGKKKTNKKNNKKKFILIGFLGLGIISVILIYIFRTPAVDLTYLKGVSKNLEKDDTVIMELYKRFNPENGVLFDYVGSETKNGFYGFYYQADKINYKDLPDVLKNYIVVQNLDYKAYSYNEEGHYYEVPLTVLKDVYYKIFGKNDMSFNFDVTLSPKVEVVKEVVRVYDYVALDYTSAIDTYLVNGVYQDNKIIIYERVAFIKINSKDIEFYADYERTKLVYTLEKKGTNLNFLKDQNLVSNVLLQYQDKFPLYQYTYVKGVDSYYFKSIES